MTKKLLSCFAVLSLFVMCASSTNVYASTNDANTNNDVLIQPRWWPGNPNPQPGTEEWFFQHPDYGPKGDSQIAQKCAIEALFPSLGSSALSEITIWIAKGVFSVGSFGISFGSGFVVSYGVCVWNAVQ